MRKILVLAAFAVLAVTDFVQAYPTDDHVSYSFTVSSGAGRGFYTSRTTGTVGCQMQTGTTCPSGMPKIGHNPSGKACCAYRGNESENTLENLATDYHWGYIGTTSRSPNAGRAQSASARLDACIGHSETDMLGTGSTGWSNCYNKCDSSANGYCTGSGTNDGSSTSAAVCKDRCDCVMGFGTCANL